MPSSVAEPLSVTVAGRVTVWSGPASATGAWFGGGVPYSQAPMSIALPTMDRGW